MRFNEFITEATNPAQQAAIAISKKKDQGVAEGLNEFAPDSFNGGGDGDAFSPEIAKMAQEDGFTKGAGLADGATLERAITINHWHSQHGGMYKQYFAKGFKAGRMNKINHDNKQYNLNLKLMKDGSIRHGEQGVAEMDSQGYTGSRDKKSNSKYGSRDDYELGKGKEHTGKAITANNMVKAAKKVWDYATEPVDAPNIETYKKHRAKNIANIRKNKEQGVAEGENWSKHNHKRVGGMSDKSVKSYRRSHPGSKIQTAVTTKPSKLKKGSKDAKRRASFCARMRGMKKHRTSAKTARDPNSNINKSLRRWHCESIEQMQELVMLAEQFIRNHKK